MSLEINTEDFWKEIDKRVVEHRIEKKLMSEEITKLREQVAAQAAVIESLKSALTGLLAYNPEQEWIGGAENGYYQTVGTCLLKEIQQAKAALANPTDSTQILDEVRRAERERVAQMILNGRFLHDESPAAQFAKEVAAAIRAME